MRNLNYLRKSERKSVGTTLALTVGSPSVLRRSTVVKHLAFMLLFLLGSLNVWGGTGSITFDFEDDGAHRASGNNSYAAGPQEYSQNSVTISCVYMDVVTTGTPIAGSANALGRVAKNTTNSPVLLIGPIDMTDKTITEISYSTKGVAAMSQICEYSTNGTSWNSAVSLENMPTTATGETSGTISVTGTSTFYVRITTSVASSTGSNRDLQIDDIVISYSYDDGGNPTCVTPTFSPEEGAVVSGTNVSISSTTEGATIYYTTDGTVPSTSSATSQPIEITSATTIKAIAVKDGYDNSDVATAVYTILEPKTIAQIMPTSETEGDAFLLNNVTVTYAYGNNVFVKDATGYMMVYSSITGAANGKVLQGLQGKAKLYKGLPEISTVTQAPTVIDGSAVEPVDLVNYPTDADLNKYVTLEGVTFASAATLSGSVTNVTGIFDGSNLIFRNTFKLDGVSLATGKSYRVVGVVQKYNSDYQVYPISIEEIVEEGAPEAPTFSVAAGTYTSVQSVELSCATEGATIYYTTNGDTPDNTSTEYTAAISVGENMTIKAIAIKDTKSSSLAEAEYVINLPEDESVRKTWDLSVASYSANSADQVTWSATYVNMVADKYNSTTAANNYLGGDANNRTSSRFYKDSKLTITPSDKQISTIVFTATSESYATALANSTWTNATAEAAGSVVTVTAAGIGAVSAVVGATCGFTAVQVNYGPIDTSIPEAPTFSVAAGTYTSVQSVELSCATEGATIYYTTNGDTPDNTSTEYTAAISVGENMTIKAIAIKDTKSSSVVEAAYVINLPDDENVRKTWDLSTDSYVSDPEPTADLIQWTATYVSMKNERTGTETAVNNYIPTAKTSTRFYSGNKLTITPNGKQISTIVFTATSESYATALANSTWTNATAEAAGSVVTVTAAGPGAVVAAVGGTCGFTAVQVNYGPIDPSIPEAPTFSVAAGTYTSVQSVELSCATEGATIYYTTNGDAPDNTSTEYTAAISVGENMTIKAIAIKDTKSSAVAEAVYVINLPIILTTMQAIFDKADEVKSTATDVTITFDSWVISAVSLNGKNAYLTDGTKGLIIFDNESSMGFNVGDVLSGSAACKVQLYKGAAELTMLNSSTEGLTINTGGVITPATKTIDALSGVNTGAPIIVENVKFDGTDLVDASDNKIQPYNSVFAYGEAFTENKYYNVTGIYQQFDSKKEILPRSAADIDELTQEAPTMTWYTSNAKEATIAANATYTINLGDAFAPVFETNSTGALTYSSSDDAVAEINETTGALTLKGVTGTTFIKCEVAAAGDYTSGEQGFTLRVREAVAGENVVIVALFNDGVEDKWLAMKHDMTALEVNYSAGTIYDLSTSDQESITWNRVVDGDDVTFQDPSNDYYLKGGASTTLSVAEGESDAYQWAWDGTNGYYTTNTSGTIRTFLFQGDAAKFRNYAVGNAGGSGNGGYSQLPVVTAAVFATTPPTKDVIRDGLSAGKWGTLCPKQTVEYVEGATFYQISYLEEQGGLPYNVVFDQISGTTLTAGQPYFFIAEGTEIRGIKTGAELTEAGDGVNGFYGYIGADPMELTVVHEEYEAGSNNTFVIHNNSVFRLNQGGTMLKSERCYINISSSEPSRNIISPAPGRNRIRMSVQNTNVATGMDAINASEKPMKLMIDGQLFILRGEKMYDAKGQLVK